VKSAPSGPELRARHTHRLLTALAFVLLAALGPSLRAEVAVVTDSHGRYVRTVSASQFQGGQRLYWTARRHGMDGRLLLNPSGDRFGDSAPVIAEQPGTRQPWVVWTTSDGKHSELAYATWHDGHWQGPALLLPTQSAFDDLNPRLGFDSEGRPVVAWWRNEPTPKVFLSLYSGNAWSAPIAVSDASVPSRYPSLRFQGKQAVVSFFTPRGQTVLYEDLAQPAVQMDSNGPLDGPVPPPATDQNGGGSGGTSDPANHGCAGNCPDTPRQSPHNNDGA
jgi:hypothetical protein